MLALRLALVHEQAPDEVLSARYRPLPPGAGSQQRRRSDRSKASMPAVAPLPPPEILPTLLTVAQVARACQVSTRTIRRAIAAGELEAFQLARRGTWRIRPEDVSAWLEECLGQRSATPAPSPTTTRPSVSQLSDARRHRGEARAATGQLTVPGDAGRAR